MICCLTILYLNQEQPGLGRTKRLASQHRQLPPKQGHNQRRRITAVGKPPSSDHLANPFEERQPFEDELAAATGMATEMEV